jgi:hypothetical protein
MDNLNGSASVTRFGSDKAAGALVLGALFALIGLHTYFRTVIGG